MDVKLVNAAAAYAAQQLKGGAAAKGAAASGVEASTQASFSNVLNAALKSSVETAQRGEAVSMQALVNPGDLGQVVTAVTSAEITMQTVVAVRDRVVQAYQDILRMPI